MNKKILTIAGLGTGAILTGVGLAVRHINKKAKNKEVIIIEEVKFEETAETK